MNIIDAIVIAFLLAIVALFRYAWKHRKRTVKRKRVPLERTGERYGKSRAAEREWIKRNSHV